MSYPRRQQYRRLSHAGRLALISAPACVFGLFLPAIGVAAPGTVLLLIAAMLGLRARHSLGLAVRIGVGARSEDEVQRALDPLRRKGWRIRHSVTFPGGGDIDSVLAAPNGVAFAIETKTRTYDERQLGRVLDQARWLARRRRRWCRGGAVPVLCVVRAGGAERYERGVLVVSIDRLLTVLWEVANGAERRQATPRHGLSLRSGDVGEGPDGEQASECLGDAGRGIRGAFV